ncbi:hypothetical protein DM860_004235 [Cuscuta australis]|uniref:4-coumarate--CoA ligase n=1 Tax=Cuscuta australis TaxID=267555 RepID=A0A328E6Y5_9ASTE|nr:hypothetical protein DM860_004235 [Cuscuta australis]
MPNCHNKRDLQHPLRLGRLDIISTQINSMAKIPHKSNVDSIEPGGEGTPFPHWYSPETGIYRSKHPSVQLPADPLLDVVSLIFSHNHSGAASLVDSRSGFSISYPEFYSLVKSVAGGLHLIGVSQGDVVLFLLPNSVYFPVLVLSVLSLGAVAAPMNPLSTSLEIKKQALDGNCNVRLAFSSVDRVGDLAEFGIPAIGLPEGTNNLDFPADSVFFKLISTDPNTAPRPRIRQQDAAAILFSSGTTGSSKGVILTHANLIATVKLFVRFEASQYEGGCRRSRENVYLGVLPMFHVYGLSLFVMGLLSLGSTVVVMRKYDEDEMERAVEKYDVTHIPVVPPLLRALTRKAKVGTRAATVLLKGVKQVSSGAAPVPAACVKDFLQTFPHIDFIQGYGLTESAAVGTRGFNTAKIHKYSSVGLLAPNIEAKVVDWNTFSPLPPKSSGELWLRGPSIMKGYLNNEEASKRAIDHEGWLHTGDIVSFDEDGYLYVQDRLKDIIKYKGFQIGPADLEAVLMSHPDVTDAAVTSEVDEEVGEIPVALVVRGNGSALTEANLIDFVANHVAPYKKVRRVYFTTSIPKSSTEKILRKELRKLLPSKM